MKKLTAHLFLLLGCSSSAGTPESRASLQVTFGAGPALTLDAPVMSNATSTRWMLQASDSHVTVFLSLARPVAAQQLAVSSDGQVASIWAKEDQMSPLIATSGSLTLDALTATTTLDLANVAKPADSTGASLLVAGSLTGVTVPQ